MDKKIQTTIGKKLNTHLQNKGPENPAFEDEFIGDLAIKSIKEFVQYGVDELNQMKDYHLIIHSENLGNSMRQAIDSRESIYKVMQVLLLNESLRSGFVRAQIFFDGLIVEALLLDSINSYGLQRNCDGKVVKIGKKTIVWKKDGILSTSLRRGITLDWLIKTSYYLNIIDKELKSHLDEIRSFRNLIHAAKPDSMRWDMDIDQARLSKEALIKLYGLCKSFKIKRNLLNSDGI